MNKEKNVTIKDVADKSGYSAATVHRALKNKGGISEETRSKIVEIAKSLGYTNNYIASALSRKQINIAIVLPYYKRSWHYYFEYMVRGINDYNDELYSYNLRLIESYYDNDSGNGINQIQTLVKLFMENQGNLDGLIISPVGAGDDLKAILNQFSMAGTQIVLLDDDLKDVNRICCISPSDMSIGELGAELICGFIKDRHGSVLVAAGNPDQNAHSLNTAGFSNYLKKYRPDVDIVIIEEKQGAETSQASIEKVIKKHPDLIAAYSVRARNSIALCKAIEAQKFEEKPIVIGSDLFPESADFLNKGILSAIIYKNPYEKGYTALNVLFDSLFKGLKPKEDLIEVPIGIIMKSNLRFYKKYI